MITNSIYRFLICDVVLMQAFAATTKKNNLNTNKTRPQRANIYYLFRISPSQVNCVKSEKYLSIGCTLNYQSTMKTQYHALHVIIIDSFI